MNNHTLTSRVNDLKLEFKLWGVAWLALSALIAGVTFFARMPNPGETIIWRDYLVSRALELLGLGSVPVGIMELDGGDIAWDAPANILSAIREGLPEYLSAYDHDLYLIASAPLLAALAMAGIALIFSRKRS